MDTLKQVSLAFYTMARRSTTPRLIGNMNKHNDMAPPKRSSTVSANREDGDMSIVDDLVSNLVERNAVRLNGTFTISLVEGGITFKGQVLTTLRDQKKAKDVLNANAPIEATVKVGDIRIPVPQIK